ncbi:MAG: carbon monoxide dehydrogenase subunit G [SAR202 cluster bacterium]|nr:carbon monoxide dehydrogenase subunit G [SAR202 cluster bacterium]
MHPIAWERKWSDRRAATHRAGEKKLKIEGSYEIKAARERVWDLLNDVDVLRDCIPGCESLTPAGPDTFEAELSVGIGMIRGSYSGRVRISDRKKPGSYRLEIEGEGPGGFIKGDATITLQATGESVTTVTVDGDGEVGGMLARVGQRLIGQASKSLMKQFFDCAGKKARG